MNELKHKYRPEYPKDFIGKTQQAVAKVILQGSQPNWQTILFTGPTGTGKTSLAMAWFAHFNVQYRQFNCADLGVKDINEITGWFGLSPMTGTFNGYLFDELHLLPEKARKALLVPLENLPPHILIAATSSAANKIAREVRDRFEPFELTRLSVANINERIKFICEKENLEITDDQIRTIIQNADGSLRSVDNDLSKVKMGLPLDQQFDPQTEPILRLIYGGSSLRKVFQASKEVTGHASVLIGIFAYAVKVLSSEKASDEQIIKSLNIINALGKGGNLKYIDEYQYYYLITQLLR
jgi:replication-associated recombination protein RarA